MGAYLLRRTLGAVPLLLFVSVAVYGLLQRRRVGRRQCICVAARG